MRDTPACRQAGMITDARTMSVECIKNGCGRLTNSPSSICVICQIEDRLPDIERHNGKESMTMKDKFQKAREVLGVENVDNFLAKFGLGPKYKPIPQKTYECPKCKKQNAYYKEIHPDTGMDEIVLFCPDCHYRGDQQGGDGEEHSAKDIVTNDR